MPNAITKATSLQKVFNDVEEVLVTAAGKQVIASTVPTEALTELPVIEGSVSINMGEAEVSFVKTTTGKVWCSKVKGGDPEFTMQIPSLAGKVNEMFLNAIEGDVKPELTGIGKFTGKGYNTQPKMVNCAVYLPSADRSAMFVFPNVEIYATLVPVEGDNCAYFNLKCTIKDNAEGVNVYILEKDLAPGG